MTARGRKELLCGLGSGFFGLLLLLDAYLQPYTDTRYPQPISLHPGFTPTETFFIIVIGVPILGIVIGASLHSFTRSATAGPVRWLSAGARLLLWIATAVLTLGALYGLIEIIGLFLAPSAVFGIFASLLARDARSGSAQPTPTMHPTT